MGALKLEADDYMMLPRPDWLFSLQVQLFYRLLPRGLAVTRTLVQEEPIELCIVTDGSNILRSINGTQPPVPSDSWLRKLPVGRRRSAKQIAQTTFVSERQIPGGRRWAAWPRPFAPQTPVDRGRRQTTWKYTGTTLWTGQPLGPGWTPADSVNRGTVDKKGRDCYALDWWSQQVRSVMDVCMTKWTGLDYNGHCYTPVNSCCGHSDSWTSVWTSVSVGGR